MTQHKQLNNKTLTLNGAINASTTSITVTGTTTDVDSNKPIYASINAEIVEITGVAAQVLTVVRGAQGTTAASHADLDTMSFFHTAANINELIDEKQDEATLTTKGDIYVRTSTDIVRLPIGADDQVLTADAAETPGMKWATPSAGGGGGGSNAALVLFDDFVTGNEDSDELGTYGWRRQASGTGNQFTRIDAESGHDGILRLQNGNTNSARTAVYIGESGSNTVFPAGGELVWESVIRWTFSATTDVFAMVLGLTDNAGVRNGQNNGIYFRRAATNWEIVANNAGALTVVDTGTAHSSTTWVKLRFTLNAAATSIQANIDGSDVGSAITTNIPTVALSPEYRIDGISGGSGTQLDIDYFSLQRTYSTAR